MTPDHELVARVRIRQVPGGPDAVQGVHRLGLTDQVRVWPRCPEPLVVGCGDHVAGVEELGTAFDEQRLTCRVRDQ
jgi:hypothetical protein